MASLFLPLVSLFLILTLSEPAPVPKPWPLQFHSTLYQNSSLGALALIDLWYDFPNGRNFNIIQSQLGELLYDLEWTNGTSFFYTLDSAKKCSTYHFDVGILRPDWLAGANYQGQKMVDGFLCNVWDKVDFITYYEHVDTKMPVGWVFYTGKSKLFILKFSCQILLML